MNVEENDSGRMVVIFSSTLAMTMQQAFNFGYGIAAGIAIVGFGLSRGNIKSRVAGLDSLALIRVNYTE